VAVAVGDGRDDRAGRVMPYAMVLRAAWTLVGGSAAVWDDLMERTHADVLAAIDTAIAEEEARDGR
jgi:hypothetical protein